MERRRVLRVELSAEAREGLERFATVHGVTLTAALESLGRFWCQRTDEELRALPPRAEEIMAEAKRLTRLRVQRRRATPPDGTPPGVP